MNNGGTKRICRVALAASNMTSRSAHVSATSVRATASGLPATASSWNVPTTIGTLCCVRCARWQPATAPIPIERSDHTECLKRTLAERRELLENAQRVACLIPGVACLIGSPTVVRVRGNFAAQLDRAGHAALNLARVACACHQLGCEAQ